MMLTGNIIKAPLPQSMNNMQLSFDLISNNYKQLSGQCSLYVSDTLIQPKPSTLEIYNTDFNTINSKLSQNILNKERVKEKWHLTYKDNKVFASIKFKDIWGKYLYVARHNAYEYGYIRVKNFRIKVRADFYMDLIPLKQLNYICIKHMRQEQYIDTSADQWYYYDEYDDDDRADSSPYLFQVKIWKKQNTNVYWKNNFKLETSNRTKFNTAVALLKYKKTSPGINIPSTIFGDFNQPPAQISSFYCYETANSNVSAIVYEQPKYTTQYLTYYDDLPPNKDYVISRYSTTDKFYSSIIPTDIIKNTNNWQISGQFAIPPANGANKLTISLNNMFDLFPAIEANTCYKANIAKNKANDILPYVRNVWKGLRNICFSTFLNLLNITYSNKFKNPYTDVSNSQDSTGQAGLTFYGTFLPNNINIALHASGQTVPDFYNAETSCEVKFSYNNKSITIPSKSFNNNKSIWFLNFSSLSGISTSGVLSANNEIFYLLQRTEVDSKKYYEQKQTNKIKISNPSAFYNMWYKRTSIIYARLNHFWHKYAIKYLDKGGSLDSRLSGLLSSQTSKLDASTIEMVLSLYSRLTNMQYSMVNNSPSANPFIDVNCYTTDGIPLGYNYTNISNVSTSGNITYKDSFIRSLNNNDTVLFQILPYAK